MNYETKPQKVKVFKVEESTLETILAESNDGYKLKNLQIVTEKDGSKNLVINAEFMPYNDDIYVVISKNDLSFVNSKYVEEFLTKDE